MPGRSSIPVQTPGVLSNRLHLRDPGRAGSAVKWDTVIIPCADTCDMDEKTSSPGLLRIAAAILLGIVVGFFVFLAISLVLGVLNIPVSLQFAENILSAALLVLSLTICTGIFLWLVWTTPPTESGTEEE